VAENIPRPLLPIKRNPHGDFDGMEAGALPGISVRTGSRWGCKETGENQKQPFANDLPPLANNLPHYYFSYTKFSPRFLSQTEKKHGETFV
jgi:hypothetical protein